MKRQHISALINESISNDSPILKNVISSAIRISVVLAIFLYADLAHSQFLISAYETCSSQTAEDIWEDFLKEEENGYWTSQPLLDIF